MFRLWIGAVAVVGLILGAPGPAKAGWGDPGFEAYSWRDYETAIEYWTPFEAQTAPDVLVRIAWMYKFGEGNMAIDLQKAAFYFTKAAKDGDAWAQFSLAYMYHFGEGREPDLAKAYMWYSLALEGRYERSQTRLNQLSLLMTPDQIARAVQAAKDSPYRPRVADDQIMANSLRDAKLMFQKEYIIARNKEIGERGNSQEVEEVRTFGDMFDDLFSVLMDMPKYMASVFDTRAGGRTWSEVPKNVTKKAPENTSVSDYYQFGEKLKARYTEAAKQFEIAAERGDASAAANLGYLYFFGNGVPIDTLKSHMWFSLAVKGGIGRAAGLITEVEERMIPEQVEEAKRMADEWTANLPEG